MKGIQLNEQVRYDIPTQSIPTEQAKLVGEVMARAVELDESVWARFVQWQGRLAYASRQGWHAVVSTAMRFVDAPMDFREVRIYLEMTDRFIDLAEIDEDFLCEWTRKVFELIESGGRRAFLWYAFYQSGDHSAIGRTLKEAGERHYWTKQAEEQELKKDLDKIRRGFPQLVEAIEQLIERSAVRDEERTEL